MEEKAIFAGGCFWCMVQPFDTQPGLSQLFRVIQVGTCLIQHMNRF